MSPNDKLPRHVRMDSVSDKIIIGSCPLTGGKFVKVNECIKCQYHDGFAQVSFSEEFSKSYRVMCCHAVMKEVRELA